MVIKTLRWLLDPTNLNARYLGQVIDHRELAMLCINLHKYVHRDKGHM